MAREERHADRKLLRVALRCPVPAALPGHRRTASATLMAPGLVGVVEASGETPRRRNARRNRCPQCALYRASHVTQQGVAGHVTALVVHPLEMSSRQKGSRLSARSAAQSCFARGQLVPPTVVEQSGQVSVIARSSSSA